MAGCPPVARLAVLGDLIIPIPLAAFLCNTNTIITLYILLLTNLGHHDDVGEEEHGQLVTFPAQDVLCCHLDSVSSTYKTGGTRIRIY